MNPVAFLRCRGTFVPFLQREKAFLDRGGRYDFSAALHRRRNEASVLSVAPLKTLTSSDLQ